LFPTRSNIFTIRGIQAEIGSKRKRCFYQWSCCMKQQVSQRNTRQASEHAHHQALGEQLGDQAATPGPQARLRAISFLLVAPLARARFATFAQAMSSTITTAPNTR
jgi:hypothetical protein